VFESKPANGGSMLSYQFSDDILCAGQPSETDLQQLKREGYRSIINLRPANEPGQIQHPQQKTTELGLDYHALPITGPGDLNEENTRQFDALLQTAARPMVIHCGSSNRVGALMALRAAHIQNKDPREALNDGRKAGLTALEPLVAQMLGL
tara:strand:- start:2188 stop:2640 length:453 start_codon:yes stop_codon:yes gene_type:complete